MHIYIHKINLDKINYKLNNEWWEYIKDIKIKNYFFCENEIVKVKNNINFSIRETHNIQIIQNPSHPTNNLYIDKKEKVYERTSNLGLHFEEENFLYFKLELPFLDPSMKIIVKYLLPCNEKKGMNEVMKSSDIKDFIIKNKPIDINFKYYEEAITTKNILINVNEFLSALN